MSDKLVEKVARAICIVQEYEPDVEILRGGEDVPAWRAFTDEARAAIAVVLDAIAEPSEAMHHAARDWSRAKYGQPIGIDASDGCWSAMIAALRKEVEGEPIG